MFHLNTVVAAAEVSHDSAAYGIAQFIVYVGIPVVLFGVIWLASKIGRRNKNGS